MEKEKLCECGHTDSIHSYIPDNKDKCVSCDICDCIDFSEKKITKIQKQRLLWIVFGMLKAYGARLDDTSFAMFNSIEQDIINQNGNN